MWICQEYEGEVHVVPDHEPAHHVLASDCWCDPDPDPEVLLWMHRDLLDREGPVL